jgi:hypothetical protein
MTPLLAWLALIALAAARWLLLPGQFADWVYDTIAEDL